MKTSPKWHHWLSFSAFTLAGVAFEGARFGSVMSQAPRVPEASTWRRAAALSAKCKV